MYLIQRKILVKILSQTLMVFAFVGVIVTTTQVLNQVFRLIDASSNLLVALKMYAFLIPTITVSVLPIAFLIACINIYDQMDDDRESVIVTGAGVHPVFALLPAGVLALALAGVVLVLSLFVEPVANRVVRDTINSLRFDALKVIAGNGALRRVQHGLYIRGGGYNEAGEIEGLFILDRRSPSEEVSYAAQRGLFIEEDGRTFLQLHNGSIQFRDGARGLLNRIRFGKYLAEPGIFFDEQSNPDYRPRQTSTADLQALLASGEFGGYTASSVRKELIRRYTDWIYPLVFFSTCVFLVLNTSFGRSSSRWRLPAAVLLGFLIKAIGLVILGNSGASDVAAAASFVMPLGVAAALLAVSLMRASGRRRRPRPPPAQEVPA